MSVPMDYGAVRGIVQLMNNARPGGTGRDPLTPARPSSDRHGSAEHCSNPRPNRSRDTRDNRGRSSNTRDLPQVTLGTQNSINLGQQFEDVHDRLMHWSDSSESQVAQSAFALTVNP